MGKLVYASYNKYRRSFEEKTKLSQRIFYFVKWIFTLYSSLCIFILSIGTILVQLKFIADSNSTRNELMWKKWLREGLLDNLKAN